MSPRLPLFDQHLMQELKELEAERAVLSERLFRLPPNSHKRIALQGQLEMLTLKALQISTRLATPNQEIRS